MPSYLFLDFDGVLHPVGASVDRLFCQLELLEGWLRGNPSVDVVVSSSWRIPHNLNELREFFSEDLRSRVVGTTGVYWRDRYQEPGEVPVGVRHEREREVMTWLANHSASESPRWAALEDEPGLFRTQNDRVVYCDRASGLTTHELRLLDSLLHGDSVSFPFGDFMESQLDVLYLDFDGVLHPDSVYVDARRGIHLRGVPHGRLFEHAGLLEDELAAYPRVKVVLSTSWVRALGYDGARARLPEGLATRCIGATYHSRYHRPGRDEGFRGLFRPPARGEEVQADVARRRPRRWLAIDDVDEGWRPESRKHLVLTDPLVGIGSTEVLNSLRTALCRFE